MRLRSPLLALVALTVTALAPPAPAQTAPTPYATGLGDPTGLTQLADGRVLVAEGSAFRVSVISGTDGAPVDPEPYADGVGLVGDLIQLADGRVLVATLISEAVLAISDADGNGVDPAPYATGLDGPFSLVQLADGRVLVTEPEAGRVSVVSDADGNGVDPTPYATGLDDPTGLVQLADGRVLASELGADRVSVIGVEEVAPPEPETPVVVAEGLRGPTGIAAGISVDDVLIVSEYNSGDQTLLLPDGTPLSVPGHGRPGGVAMTPLSGVVFSVDRNGGDLRLTFMGATAVVASGFRGPNDVLVARDELFVLEANAKQLTAVDLGTDTRSTVATDFESPYGLAFAVDGRVLVTENAAGRVTAVAADGTKTLFAEGLDRPAGIVGLADGRALVVERGGGRVSAVGGGRPNQVVAVGLQEPTFIALNPVTGRVYVTEFARGRVVAFGGDRRYEPVTGFVGGGGTVAEAGDAGALPAPPQGAVGAPAVTGTLGPAASGRLGAGAVAETGDCFAVAVADVDAFSASTVNDGTAIDTDLVLFTEAGVAVAANDDADGTYQSRIPAGALSDRGLAPGYYVLCVTETGADPTNAAGTPILPVTGGDYEAVRYPSAPDEDYVVAAFPEVTSEAGPYRVELGGVGGQAVSSEVGPVAEGAPDLAVWPNPTAGRARVAFALAEAADVEVSVFDALGRRVVVAASGPHAAGDHEAALDTGALAPGVYVVRVRAGGAVAARTVTVVR